MQHYLLKQVLGGNYPLEWWRRVYKEQIELKIQLNFKYEKKMKWKRIKHPLVFSVPLLPEKQAPTQ